MFLCVFRRVCTMAGLFVESKLDRRFSFVFMRSLCAPLLRLMMSYYSVRGGGMNSWKLCNWYLYRFTCSEMSLFVVSPNLPTDSLSPFCSRGGEYSRKVSNIAGVTWVHLKCVISDYINKLDS